MEGNILPVLLMLNVRIQPIDVSVLWQTLM